MCMLVEYFDHEYINYLVNYEWDVCTHSTGHTVHNAMALDYMHIALHQ